MRLVLVLSIICSSIGARGGWPLWLQVCLLCSHVAACQCYLKEALVVGVVTVAVFTAVQLELIASDDGRERSTTATFSAMSRSV